jgi:cation:H+ antiporter
VTALLFVLGLALLVGGADLLVKGAARIAAMAGIAPLVIGLTVVALGTSAPELAVTVTATARGDPDMALGNVVGSNLTNLLLILGLSALVSPLVVRRRVVSLDIPILVAASVVVLILSLDGAIGRGQGGALLTAGIGYTVLLVRQARRSHAADVDRPPTPKPRRRRMAVEAAHILIGLTLLVLGSHWLVESARTIGQALGISELAIGLTIVAIGTSLPELATTVVAGIRGQTDMAIGNVLGSNLFNLLIVLGAGAAVSPDGIAANPAAIAFDMPVMLAVTIACFPVFYTGRTVTRWEGAAFVSYFVVYIGYVLLAAAGQAPPTIVRHALLIFVIPLIIPGVVITLLRFRK